MSGCFGSPCTPCTLTFTLFGSETSHNPRSLCIYIQCTSMHAGAYLNTQGSVLSIMLPTNTHRGSVLPPHATHTHAHEERNKPHTQTHTQGSVLSRVHLHTHKQHTSMRLAHAHHLSCIAHCASMFTHRGESTHLPRCHMKCENTNAYMSVISLTTQRHIALLSKGSDFTHNSKSQYPLVQGEHSL